FNILNSIENNSINNEIILNPVVSLNQNFPNPFNPSTTISFSIPIESKVNISIFNIKGQKVKTVANDQFEKGIYSILWSGDDDNGKLVSSGVYFYKLYVNGKTESVKKCLLLK
ncbi:MAG: T9SS type A sorting domain-containing protein, partial [Promethearchaeota archaeon]